MSDIQEIMGQADIDTAMRYVQATEQSKCRAIEAAVSGWDSIKL